MSGVSQGSILGPLLFLFFINDIGIDLNSRYLLYADDLKIMRSIRNVSDCECLQSDLNNVLEWCGLNRLELNISKCSVISITRKKSVNKFEYKIGNIVIKRELIVRDLGVFIDSKLDFNYHVNAICTKANKMLGFVLRRCQDFTNYKTLIILYNSLVRSQLEYCTQIWCPFYRINNSRIESIQRRFTRRIFKKFVNSDVAPYPVRLQKFNLLSLESRRLYLDEVLLFKVTNAVINTTFLSKINFYVPAYRSRNVNLFSTKTMKTNIGLSSPAYRLQSNHNNFFNDLDIFNPSLLLYKKSILNTINRLLIS